MKNVYNCKENFRLDRYNIMYHTSLGFITSLQTITPASTIFPFLWSCNEIHFKKRIYANVYKSAFNIICIRCFALWNVSSEICDQIIRRREFTTYPEFSVLFSIFIPQKFVGNVLLQGKKFNQLSGNWNELDKRNIWLVNVKKYTPVWNLSFE